MNIDPSWKLAAPPQPLEPRCLHFWSFSIEPEDWPFEELSRLLDPEERERAARFHFAPDRQHFMVGRALLRRLLGVYLQADPAAVRLHAGRYGKPRLAAPFNQSGLHFNLAHSGGRAVLAIAQGVEVGADLEHLRQFPDMDAVAECSFSSGEVSSLRSLQGLDKVRQFYALWTCKEAYLKACGDGLIDSLQNIEVQLQSDRGQLQFLGSEAVRCFAWPLYRFEPMHGYLASVTAAGAISRIQCFEWMNQALVVEASEQTGDTVFFTAVADPAEMHSVT